MTKISVGNGSRHKEKCEAGAEAAKTERKPAKSLEGGEREILMGASASVVAGISKQRGAKMSAERKFNRRNLTENVLCHEDKT